MYLCFDIGFVESHCPGLVFKFMKAGCSASCTLFEQDGVVSVLEVREIFISDVYYSQITSAVAEIQSMARRKRAEANMHP